MDRSHFLNALGGELRYACMQHPAAIYARLQYMQIHARPLQYLEESCGSKIMAPFYWRVQLTVAASAN